MRILLACQAFRSVHSVAEILDKLATQFIAAGHAAAVVSDPYLWSSIERKPRPDLECFYLRIPERKPASWRHPERLVKRPRGTSELLECVRRWRPDVVGAHLHQEVIGYVCRKLDVPLVLTLYGTPHHNDAHRVPPILRYASKTIALSAATRDYFARLWPPVRDAEVIISGVETDAADAAAPLRRERPYIFCAARLYLPHKAIDVLVSAFALIAARYPNFDLLITGEGPDRERIEAVIASHGLQDRVQLLGLRPRAELWSLYKGATIFAMPSRKTEGGWGEGLGVVFLEAMACGIPVIGTRVGGVPEVVIGGETGLLIDRSEPEELAAAMRKLLDDQESRAEMGRRGLEFASRHCWPRVAERYLRVYESCTRTPERVATPSAGV